MFSSGFPALNSELNMADFGTKLLLYWMDPALYLEETEDLNGQWNSVPSASPVEVPVDRLHQFFRLQEP